MDEESPFHLVRRTLRYTVRITIRRLILRYPPDSPPPSPPPSPPSNDDPSPDRAPKKSRRRRHRFRSDREPSPEEEFTLSDGYGEGIAEETRRSAGDGEDAWSEEAVQRPTTSNSEVNEGPSHLQNGTLLGLEKADGAAPVQTARCVPQRLPVVNLSEANMLGQEFEFLSLVQDYAQAREFDPMQSKAVSEPMAKEIDPM